ncbi:MAG: hypothetical protein RIQ93_3479, partial [Verrucomicrobiota bacterium]
MRIIFAAGLLLAGVSPRLAAAATPATATPVLAPLLQTPAGTIARPEAWSQERARLREQWLAFLGRFPTTKAPLKTKIIATEELPEFTRHYVTYQVEDGVVTDGYLLTPKNLLRRAPAVVVFHQTTKTQAQQAAGIDPSNPELMHGVQLVQRGYIVWCPRCFIFAEGADYA